jgi:hypothetical protein
MDGSWSWYVEAKVFEVQIKGGDSGVRIYERSKKKQCSIFVRRDEIAWLVGALEEVAEDGKSKVFWDQSRAGLPRLITQRCSNRHGRFLVIEEFEGRRRGGSILVPEGRYGQGWARLMVELDGANTSIWEGRTPPVRPSEPAADIPSGLAAQTVAAFPPATMAVSRIPSVGHAGGVEVSGVEAQVAPAPQKISGPCATATTKSLKHARGALGSGVPGVYRSDGAGMEGLLGGATSKGRWVQALLNPAPLSEELVCRPRQGKEVSRQTREEQVREGVSSFNAKLELSRCREWLQKIRDEVDVGLQRLDLVIKEVDLSGPDQGCPDYLWAAKPTTKSGPNGKMNSKASSVGLVWGPKGGFNPGQPRRSYAHVASASVGQDHRSGPSGHSKGSVQADLGLQGVGCPNRLSAEVGLGASNGVVPIKSTKAHELAVGRSGLDVDTGTGSPVPVSSRVGESGSVSSSAKAGLEAVECSVSSSKWGESGQPLGSPAPANRGLKTPARLSLGKRVVSTEPSKLQVYQRSLWRSSKPLQSFGLSCKQSRGPMGHLPVSPVCLDFDGVGVVPSETVSVPPPAMPLDSALSSVEVVPESVSGEVSAGLGSAGADSVVAEKLDRALDVGEVAGLTSDGQPGLLKEFLGQIVVNNHSRSAGGVRGSQVLNES